jgi:hypothetical protein
MGCIRALCSALLVAVALMGTTHTAAGGVGPPPSTLLAMTGLNDAGLPTVQLFNPEDPDGCWL